MKRASVRATWSNVLWLSLRTMTRQLSSRPVPGPFVRGSSTVDGIAARIPSETALDSPNRAVRLRRVKVLVTGASGFLGSAVCAGLLERGHTVSALARRPGSVPDGVEELEGDLTDGEGVRTALAAARPEAVVHLAAEIASQRDEAKIREVNVHGTARLVEACGVIDGPEIVVPSTRGTREADRGPLTEETELPVETPYGRSKQEGERLLRESGLPSVVIRPGHVYGPGGWYEH